MSGCRAGAGGRAALEFAVGSGCVVLGLPFGRFARLTRLSRLVALVHERTELPYTEALPQASQQQLLRTASWDPAALTMLGWKASFGSSTGSGGGGGGNDFLAPRLLAREARDIDDRLLPATDAPSLGIFDGC